jgi:hypothetical protein
MKHPELIHDKVKVTRNKQAENNPKRLPLQQQQSMKVKLSFM